MKEEFFVIEIKRGEAFGFVIDSPTGILISEGGFHPNVKQFGRKTDANDFCIKNKLHKVGVIRIVSNIEIMDKFGTKTNQQAYVIENEKGHKLFYDTKNQLYYFEPTREAGCCAWFDKPSADKAVEGLQKIFQDQKLKPVKL